VYGCAGGLPGLPGTLAEYIAADTRLVALKPKTLSMKEATALPCLVGITAHEDLVRAGIYDKSVSDGEPKKVLVHGGTGGVGHVAVQLAKRFGASVYATCSGSEVQVKLIESYGADGVISYKKDSVESYVTKYTGGKGCDIVYDTVGGKNMLNSFEAAALNGQVATTVTLFELDLTTAHFKGFSIHVVFMLIPMFHNVKREEHGEILADIAKICDDGALKPLLDKTEFKLEQVGDAHARLESKKAVGKVVVENY
jgi:NADPH:quinone reductase